MGVDQYKLGQGWTNHVGTRAVPQVLWHLAPLSHLLLQGIIHMGISIVSVSVCSYGQAVTQLAYPYSTLACPCTTLACPYTWGPWLV